MDRRDSLCRDRLKTHRLFKITAVVSYGEKGNHMNSKEQRTPCIAPGCQRDGTVRGLCRLHYMREYKERRKSTTGDVHLGRNRSQPPECSVAGCDEHTYSKSMCRLHYEKILFESRGKCKVEGCQRLANATTTRCTAHYKAERRVVK